MFSGVSTCERLREKDGRLAVVACDSGSDKTFDFLGAARVLECVKEIIVILWSNVVFFRENREGRRLELIEQSLPLLERLEKMKETDPERAELLKRQVVESAIKFREAGVTIPEIEKHTVFNPRQLMRPEPKLLISEPADGAAADTEQPQELTEHAADLDDPEFKKAVEEFIRERRRQRQVEKKDVPAGDKRESPDDKGAAG